MKYRIERKRRKFRWIHIWMCYLMFTIFMYIILIITHNNQIQTAQIDTSKTFSGTESQNNIQSIMLYPIERSKTRKLEVNDFRRSDMKSLTKHNLNKEETPIHNKKIQMKLTYNKTKTRFTPLQVSDDVASNMIADLYPNIPIRYWLESNRLYNTEHNQYPCATFPNIYNLNIHNQYWQTIHMSNATTVQIYSAFYDNRPIARKSVRILAMVNKSTNSFPGNRIFHCQLWFNSSIRPTVVQIDNFNLIWPKFWNAHKDGIFGPYIMGCSIPESHIKEIPLAVSIVENVCDNATNMLRVVYNKPDIKKEFAVCVKGLDFLQIDLSFRLVEWIELLFLMGVDKIFFYNFEIHPNIKTVLEYYINLGKVDVRNITLPEGETPIPFIRHKFLLENNMNQCFNEIIPYNDCFYRNLYSYEYVALFDIDEIILPLKDDNWYDLIKRAKSYDKTDVKYNSFVAQHIYFLDEMDTESPYEDIPPYMHMLQHVYRAKNFSSWHSYVKTIMCTNYTVACFNHFPILVASGTEGNYFTYEDARVQHYRKEYAIEIKPEEYEKNPVKDTTLWRYKNILIPKVEHVVDTLKLFDLYKTNKN